MEELTKARCSRFFLTNIVHTPFFNDVVIGAYCTVRNGPSSQGTGEFRIVKVVDVVYQKVYTLERTKTNKALKTIWGLFVSFLEQQFFFQEMLNGFILLL